MTVAARGRGPRERLYEEAGPAVHSQHQVTLATSGSEVRPCLAFASAACRISRNPLRKAAARISSEGRRSTIICFNSGVSIRTCAATIRPEYPYKAGFTPCIAPPLGAQRIIFEAKGRNLMRRVHPRAQADRTQAPQKPLRDNAVQGRDKLKEVDLHVVNRAITSKALLACTVVKQGVPVSAACTAIDAVSLSRISPDHDLVGVVPQDRAQTPGECQPLFSPPRGFAARPEVHTPPGPRW